ncbi:hypothetical protein [Peterkaempfera griseoplana]|uniref:hypothetical protein n=1 Tax=Peterkaempfera griseoplana TaxID=66896 RepID=UPI0006E18BFF|nr:hypothetical protein [Peterkaempfera griseoplana]
MTALGPTHTPAVMPGKTVRLQDEIQFNLLHNRVETEASVVYAEPGEIGTWSWVPWQSIRVEDRKNLSLINAIGRMAAAHGPGGSVVMDDHGRSGQMCVYLPARQWLTQRRAPSLHEDPFLDELVELVQASRAAPFDVLAAAADV